MPCHGAYQQMLACPQWVVFVHGDDSVTGFTADPLPGPLSLLSALAAHCQVACDTTAGPNAPPMPRPLPASCAIPRHLSERAIPLPTSTISTRLCLFEAVIMTAVH